MNIVDLATKTLQLAIETAVTRVKTVVDGIKTVADATKTKVDTIDTRTTTMDTNINTANTSLSTLLAGRVIKNVQRGTYQLDASATSGDAAISAVDLSKSIVIINQKNAVGANNGDQAMCEFATSTTLRFSKSDVDQVAIIYWQVIEYY